jgi:hypothetical protein
MSQPPRPPVLLDRIELRLLVGGKAYGSWFPGKIIFIANNKLTCKTGDGAILIRELDEYGFIWRYEEKKEEPNGVSS